MTDDLTQACNEIREAMKGLGTDEDTLINKCLEFRLEDRLKITEAYKETQGRDLLADFASELSGDLKTAMLGLYTHPMEWASELINKSIKGAGTDDDALIEIIATKTSEELREIKEKYKIKYKTELEKDIKGDTSGDYQKLLLALINTQRNINDKPDSAECKKYAKELYDCTENKKSDTSVFIIYFTTLSNQELRKVVREYFRITNKKDIMEGIDSRFDKEMKKLLKTIVYFAISPSEYFATRLQDAIKGVGKKEDILTRVLVNRSEIDLPQIKKYYKQLYKKNLVEDIKAEVSGDFGTLINGLLEEDEGEEEEVEEVEEEE